MTGVVWVHVRFARHSCEVLDSSAPAYCVSTGCRGTHGNIRLEVVVMARRMRARVCRAKYDTLSCFRPFSGARTCAWSGCLNMQPRATDLNLLRACSCMFNVLHVSLAKCVFSGFMYCTWIYVSKWVWRRLGVSYAPLFMADIQPVAPCVNVRSCVCVSFGTGRWYWRTGRRGGTGDMVEQRATWNQTGMGECAGYLAAWERSGMVGRRLGVGRAGRRRGVAATPTGSRERAAHSPLWWVGVWTFDQFHKKNIACCT